MDVVTPVHVRIDTCFCIGSDLSLNSFCTFRFCILSLVTREMEDEYWFGYFPGNLKVILEVEYFLGSFLVVTLRKRFKIFGE